jgi:translation initiation factor IF-1
MPQVDEGHATLGCIAGKMRRHRIHIVLGDRVTEAAAASPTQQ